jgi:hypothetical protein
MSARRTHETVILSGSGIPTSERERNRPRSGGGNRQVTNKAAGDCGQVAGGLSLALPRS